MQEHALDCAFIQLGIDVASIVRPVLKYNRVSRIIPSLPAYTCSLPTVIRLCISAKLSIKL